MNTSIKLVFIALILCQFSFAQVGNLELTGSVSIGDSKEPNPQAGTIRWNGFDLEGFNGHDWISLTDGQTAPVTDIVGNTYTTVNIGGRIWMAENLRTNRFADGTIIPQISDNAAWDTQTNPAWCYFDNSSSNNIPHGKLYNWYAVDDTELCPTGWGVPSDTDFENLATALGGNDEAGGKMKQEGLATWNTPNTGATNESRFTAVGSGGRVFQGAFSELFGYGAQFWTTSEHDTNKAWYYSLSYNSDNLSTFQGNKQYGYAVRCIKKPIEICTKKRKEFSNP